MCKFSGLCFEGPLNSASHAETFLEHVWLEEHIWQLSSLKGLFAPKDKQNIDYTHTIV